jgi:hypothetical protein
MDGTWRKLLNKVFDRKLPFTRGDGKRSTILPLKTNETAKSFQNPAEIRGFCSEIADCSRKHIPKPVFASPIGGRWLAVLRMLNEQYFGIIECRLVKKSNDIFRCRKRREGNRKEFCMAHLEIRSKVGSDGFLVLNVPSQANREVKITVDSISDPAEASFSDWERTIEETAGKWQGEPLERPAQGAFERRDDWKI